MNNDRLWQIDGYLLEDPTVDRVAFEQQMLDDPTLALQVAEVAQRFELLTKVAIETSILVTSRSNPASNAVALQSASQPNSNQSRRLVFAVMIATAAALLIALIPTQFSRGNNRLDQLAINWLALESEVSSDSAASTSTTTMSVDADMEHAESDSSISLAVNDNSSSENGANEDWLLDTAVIFFSDSGL